MPETPRTWTLWRTTDMRWMSGDNDDIGGPIEVVEKAPIDVERERLLDLLERTWHDVLAEYGPHFDTEPELADLLREYGRLGKEES